MPGSNDPFSPISSRGARPSRRPTKKTRLSWPASACPIKDDDPDYPALLVGNFILGGGGLSSRIADRLRQKGGSPTPRCPCFKPARSIPGPIFMVMAIYNPTNVDKGRDGRRRGVRPPAQATV